MSYSLARSPLRRPGRRIFIYSSHIWEYVGVKQPTDFAAVLELTVRAAVQVRAVLEHAALFDATARTSPDDVTGLLSRTLSHSRTWSIMVHF